MQGLEEQVGLASFFSINLIPTFGIGPVRIRNLLIDNYNNTILILFQFSIICIIENDFTRAAASVRARRQRRARSKEFSIDTLIFIILFILNFVILLFLLKIIFLGGN
jgi:hypothetical protein